MKYDSTGKVRDIFDGLSQHLPHNPENVRLISDRCLIRDLGDAEKIGTIFIPESARDTNGAIGKGGLLRLGVVVAVGPGDNIVEWVDPDGHGAEFGVEIKRRLIEKDGVPITVPPQVSVGDKVIYDRRKSEEVYLEGQRYQLSHAEQAVLAVVEG